MNGHWILPKHRRKRRERAAQWFRKRKKIPRVNQRSAERHFCTRRSEWAPGRNCPPNRINPFGVRPLADGFRSKMFVRLPRQGREHTNSAPCGTMNNRACLWKSPFDQSRFRARRSRSSPRKREEIMTRCNRVTNRSAMKCRGRCSRRRRACPLRRRCAIVLLMCRIREA